MVCFFRGPSFTREVFMKIVISALKDWCYLNCCHFVLFMEVSSTSHTEGMDLITFKTATRAINGFIFFRNQV